MSLNLIVDRADSNNSRGNKRIAIAVMRAATEKQLDMAYGIETAGEWIVSLEAGLLKSALSADRDQEYPVIGVRFGENIGAYIFGKLSPREGMLSCGVSPGDAYQKGPRISVAESNGRGSEPEPVFE